MDGRVSEVALLEAIQRMNKQDRKEIAQIVIDPMALFILGVTSKRCLTINDISPAVNLPIATCYKLVYQMENMGLMTKSGVSRTSGRGKAATYTSILKTLNLEVKNGAISLVVTWKNGQTMMFRKDLSAVVNVQTSCTDMYEKDMQPQFNMSKVEVEDVHDFNLTMPLVNKRAKVL
jgi:predicted transcriptional regulator